MRGVFSVINLKADRTIGGMALNLLSPAGVLSFIRILVNQDTLNMYIGDGRYLLKDLNINTNLYRLMPYVITLIVLAFTSGNSRAPKAEGIPYDKGMR